MSGGQCLCSGSPLWAEVPPVMSPGPSVSAELCQGWLALGGDTSPLEVTPAAFCCRASGSFETRSGVNRVGADFEPS